MSDTAKWILGIVGAVLLVVLWSYQGNNSNYHDVKGGEAKVANMYARQADLLGNLERTAREGTKQERLTIVGNAEARTAVARATADLAKAGTSPEAMKQYLESEAKAGAAIATALRGFSAVAESVPVVQSVGLFSSMMAELSGSMNRIAVERGRWIDAIVAYNKFRSGFPGVITAGVGSFKEIAQYTASPEQMKTPEVFK